MTSELPPSGPPKQPQRRHLALVQRGGEAAPPNTPSVEPERSAQVRERILGSSEALFLQTLARLDFLVDAIGRASECLAALAKWTPTGNGGWAPPKVTIDRIGILLEAAGYVTEDADELFSRIGDLHRATLGRQP